MSHVIDEITHNVIDDDGIYRINPVTREITYERNGIADYFGGPVLVKGDHNSERLTFKIPKTIEGHDMSSCNLIRIHYITIDLATSAQYKDAYDVPLSDRIDSDDNDLIFTWLVDRNVTRSVGPISFVIQFACTTETERIETEVDETTGEAVAVKKTVSITEYSWSTVPYNDLSVSEGITNTKQEADDFVDEYNSIVIAWYNEIEAAIARSEATNIVKMEQTTTSTEDGGENVWTATHGDNTTSEFKVRNGSKGSQGLSAYEIANKDGKYASEQEWLDSLKASGYTDCLKGETITQEDYDSLSEDKKSREDFVYIIKEAKVHAHTADEAEGYVEGGAIDTAIKNINAALENKASSDHNHDEITDHEERLSYAEDKLKAIIAGPVTKTGIVSIPYTVDTGSIAKFTGTPQTITAPEGYKFTQVNIASVTADHTVSSSSVTAIISEDGKTITFDMTGATSPTSSYTGTATVNYSYVIEFLADVYHAHYAQTADNLTLTQSEILDVSSEGESATGTIYHHALDVSPGRVYLLIRHPYYGTSPRYFETAIIYIENNILPTNTPPPCLSTPFSDGRRVVVCQSESDSLWYAYGIDSEGNRADISYVSFIEL